MTHKIRIEHQSHEINALQGEYLRGYDRLTTGLMGRAFLGYFYMSNNKLVNLVAGLEWIQGQTKNVRGFNYDTQLLDNQKRSDGYLGFKLGWVLFVKKLKSMPLGMMSMIFSWGNAMALASF